MDSILKNMDEDKRERLIKSAFEEFGKHPFKNASTNNIVKNAGISKGLLYHYFSTKQELYDYLEKYMSDVIMASITGKIDWEDSDFFSRLKKVIFIKFKVSERYPFIYDFAAKAYEDKSADEIRELASEDRKELLSKIYTHNIDYSKFKEELDKGMIIKVVNWTFEKYGEGFMKEHNQSGMKFDIEAMEKEIDGFIEFFKNSFYK